MSWWSILKAVDPETWGDEPADIMCDALEDIVKVFNKEVGRNPTVFELEYGLEFSIAGLDLDEEKTEL